MRRVTRSASLALLFVQPPPGEAYAYAHGGHGSRHEERRLWAATALNAIWTGPMPSKCSAWSGAALNGDRLRAESASSHYQFTSWPATVPGHRLLGLARGHWAIENRWHSVRDVTCGEDASAIRSGFAPEIMAALRSAHLALVRLTSWRKSAEAHGHDAWFPGKALSLLVLAVT